MTKLTQQILRAIMAIALLALVAYVFWTVRFTLIYILISAVIAIIGKPIVDMLSSPGRFRVNIGRSMASALTLMLFLGVFAGIMSFFIPSLIAELKVLSTVDFESIFKDLRLELQTFQKSLFSNNLKAEAGNDLGLEIARILNAENVRDTFTGLLGGLGNLVFALFSILFITFFFLKERNLFRNSILAMVPTKFEAQILHVSPTLSKTLARYFTGILLQITIVTTIVSVGLKIAGFSNTIVIGFFAGLINVIPYLGPIIGASFGLIIGLAQVVGGTTTLGLLPAILAIMVVFGAMQLIDNFLLQPLIFSRSIKAHPLEIFLVISFAAAIAGIPGMIVAVPVYSVLRLLAAEFFPEAKFVRWLIQTNLNDQTNPA
jgi:predicted PurR-regulated permease PerM